MLSVVDVSKDQLGWQNVTQMLMSKSTSTVHQHDVVQMEHYHSQSSNGVSVYYMRCDGDNKENNKYKISHNSSLFFWFLEKLGKFKNVYKFFCMRLSWILVDLFYIL